MYDENIIIKIPKALKERIKVQAGLNCQNVSEYVRSLIVKDIKENE